MLWLMLLGAGASKAAGYPLAGELMERAGLAVAEEVRRRGIAVAMMNRCLQAARSRDVQLLSLEVRQSNQAAQDFYRFLGFEPSYVRPRYYPDGEAAVIMTRRI